MKGLREKFQKNGGFTLIEMLIVVAIIAILIAVSIPMLNANLEKARHAVDEANLRSAFAVGSAKVLTDNITEDDVWYYVVATTEGSPQGSLSDTSTGAATGQCKECKEKGVLTVEYDASEDQVTASFKPTTP